MKDKVDNVIPLQAQSKGKKSSKKAPAKTQLAAERLDFTSEIRRRLRESSGFGKKPIPEDYLNEFVGVACSIVAAVYAARAAGLEWEDFETCATTEWTRLGKM